MDVNEIKETLYSMKGEEIGQTFATVSCQEDGTLLLSDIGYAMTFFNPSIQTTQVGDILFDICIDDYWRSIDFQECEEDYHSIRCDAVRLRDVDGYDELEKRYSACEKQVALSRDQVEELLGFPLEEMCASDASNITFLLYHNGNQCYITPYDNILKEEQKKIRQKIAKDVEDTEAEDELKRYCKEVVGQLDELERAVIVKRFGLLDGRKRTIQETADELGIVLPSKVQYIEKNALRHMRHMGRRNSI